MIARVVLVVLAIAVSDAATQGHQETLGSTIWDGVFSSAQADRGKRSYESACGYCHRDDLSGGGGDEPGIAPPELTGESFVARWSGASMAALLDLISTTMPYQRPKLQSDVYRDIVSYILRVNGAAPGEYDLPARIEDLRAITILTKPAR